MSDLPEEAIEAAARVIDDYRVDAPLNYPGASKAATRKARNILEAAAPVIRADERRRVAEEIRAIDPGKRWPLVVENEVAPDLMLMGRKGYEDALVDIAAQIAERSGK